jgi:DNA-binding GntR family transcriptional regulator
MKTDTVYKNALNTLLSMLTDNEFGECLPSENELRRRMGVSRTTIRKVIKELGERGILLNDGRQRAIGRTVAVGDYFPDEETTSRNQHVEQQFMEWMLRGDTKPGTTINELELARQFSVATNGIREFLNRFSRFGLIDKRANSGWIFKGFTEAFALELFEIRVMFELRSARLFAQQSETSPLWAKLMALRAEHDGLLDDIDRRYQDFSSLDNRFHRLVNEASPNRFIDDFYDIISFIFHYHYQWNKKDERLRNQVALIEHVAYIDALFSRNPIRIRKACRAHLASARKTLVRSLIETEETT